jgi:hypothetical protein
VNGGSPRRPIWIAAQVVPQIAVSSANVATMRRREGRVAADAWLLGIRMKPLRLSGSGGSLAGNSLGHSVNASGGPRRRFGAKRQEQEQCSGVSQVRIEGLPGSSGCPGRVDAGRPTAYLIPRIACPVKGNNSTNC